MVCVILLVMHLQKGEGKKKKEKKRRKKKGGRGISKEIQEGFKF